jgi:membrane protease subunit HflK
MRISRHHALVLGAMFLFSLMALFTRQANAPFLTIAAWRALLVALVFGGWTVASAPERFAALRPDRTTLKWGVIYGLLLALASSTFVGGYAFTTVANTIFLHNLAPLAAFPLAWWLFQERPSAASLTGAAVAIGGVALLSGVSLFHFSHFSHPRFLAGDALAFASAIGYAGVLVVTRATRREGTPILATLFVAWSVAALVLVALALITDGMAISPTGLLWVLGLAVLCTSLPFWLLNLGMREVGAGMAAVISVSEVLFATLLGWLVFGELLSPIGWIGGLLAVLGVLYALLARDQAADADPQEQPEPLGELTRGLRLGRLLVWLGLLNAGALLALLGGNQVGVLLAWIAVLGMLRCAQPLLPGIAGGLATTVGRWGTVAVAAGLLAALALRGGWDSRHASWIAVGLAAAAWALDVALAGREPDQERDRSPALRAAVLLVVSGQALALMQHGGARLLLILAAVATAMGAWGLLLDAFQGRLPGAPGLERGSAGRMDSAVLLLHRPGRIAGLLTAVFMLGGAHTVPPGSLAIVERLGAPLERLAQPGLLLRLPPPIERITVVDVAAIRRVELVGSDSPLLCGDHSMVAVEAVLHYRVSDPLLFAFHTDDPEAAMVQVGRSQLVRDVGHQSQDAVLASERSELEQRVREATQRVADKAELGVEVLEVHLASVQAPAAVAASYLDVISADEEKSTLVNEAEAYAARVLPMAFGEATARVLAAEGEALRSAARAHGRVERMKALHQGVEISSTTTRYRLYTEAVERALEGRPLVLLPPGRRVWLRGNGADQPLVGQRLPESK